MISQFPISIKKVFLTLLALLILFSFLSGPSPDRLDSVASFEELLTSGYVDRLEYDEGSSYIYLYLNQKGKLAKGLSMAEDGADYCIRVTRVYAKEYEKKFRGKRWWKLWARKLPHLDTKEKGLIDSLLSSPLFSSLLYFLFIIPLFFFVIRRIDGGGSLMAITSIFKDKRKKKKKKGGIKFKDVQGMEEAKEQLTTVVDILKDPKKYADLGATLPKGLLLVGPPGTGKTYLAKGLAGEAGVEFIAVSGSDFEMMFHGVGAERARGLFKEARDSAPCIIFIDEIDAVARRRTNYLGDSGGDQTLNQLLTEIDGFDSAKDRVFVVGSTNRPEVLDPAIKRPGRLGLHIFTGLPVLREREATFSYYLTKLAHALPVNYAKYLAKKTPGFSYADIADVCNSAGLIAANKNKRQVEQVDVEEAIDRKIGGIPKKEKILYGEEKQRVATHEAGHALVAHFLPTVDPLMKVTIVPRINNALGYAQYEPSEALLRHEIDILEMICTAMGGKAAEEITYGETSTGASDDLQRATILAYDYVGKFGMSKGVGPLAFRDMGRDSYLPGGRPCSEQMTYIIDQEVIKLLKEAYQSALAILRKHRVLLKKVADELLEREELSRESFEAIAGKKETKVIKSKKPSPKAKTSPKSSARATQKRGKPKTT